MRILKKHPGRDVSIPYRLATNAEADDISGIAEVVFQFLIGWLQTSQSNLQLRSLYLVSIPYRLATNLPPLELKIGQESVSIPYRLATNGDMRL